jgi:hypothetical protein
MKNILGSMISKNKNILITALIALVLTFPVFGFVYGFISSIQHNGFDLSTLLFSIVIGLWYAFTCVTTLGAVPAGDIGDTTYKELIWILPTFVTIFIILYILKKIVFVTHQK